MKKTSIKSQKRGKVENFLRDNDPILNVRGLEKKIGLPKGAIQKFLRYDNRKLDDEKIDALDKFIKNIIENYESE